MDYHQRIQRKTANQSDWAFKVNPFQTRSFGVQSKSPESLPANNAELWENYQTAKHLTQKVTNASIVAPSPTQSLPIQAKLTIGTLGDKYEQEADSVANRVMAMSAPTQVQREELPQGEEELQMKPLAATISPLVQRDELSEEKDKELQTKPDDRAIQREVAPEEELQMKPVSNSIQREQLFEEKEEIQTKQFPTPNSPSGATATPSLENRLSSSKGGGSPLSDEVRSFMEPRFGADFSGVRVHTGSEAVQMNRDVSAQAFAHGRDIYFGAGKAPAKDSLTAHELTHVVQQTGMLQKADNLLKVNTGQLTFDAEGTEGGRYHSRRPHWPGGKSGVTIGRGYDLGQKTKKQLLEDFKVSGIALALAEQLFPAIGLSGKEADNFSKQNQLIEITPEQQQNLFNITYANIESDVRRISGKKKVVTEYGKVDWKTLNPFIKDILIDLRYRGDYTPTIRQVLQPLIVKNDLVGLSLLLSDRDLWKHVPQDRFDRRKKYVDKN